MYSLTIHFGPNAMVWTFLFKDKERAEKARIHAIECGILEGPENFRIQDDFGQQASFSAGVVHGILFEDLEQCEEARILRSLAEARTRVKLDARAKTDATIRQAMSQQGPGVLTPVPNRFS